MFTFCLHLIPRRLTRLSISSTMPQTRSNFLTVTIKDLQELLCKGETTSVRLVKSYLVSIHQFSYCWIT